jgi:hypothetical protein
MTDQEAQMENFIRSAGKRDLLPLILLCLGLAASEQAVAADDFESSVDVRDARRLQQGTFFYRDLDSGKEVGTASITVRRIPDSGDYRFSNDAAVSADFSGFHSQRWQATASASFAPVSATLEFVGENQSSPVFELHYEGRHVRGFVVERKASVPPAKRSVDDPILENTVDQRIDWAAAISGSLKAGRESEFSVYDPGTGVSRVLARVGLPETIKTPAGVFPAIRISYEVEKRGKVERYVVFTTRRAPRVLIREDFPNGVVTELVRVAE